MSGKVYSDHPWFLLDISRCLVLSAGYCLQDLRFYKQELYDMGREGELLISPTWAGCNFSSREVAKRILSSISHPLRMSGTHVYFVGR